MSRAVPPRRPQTRWRVLLPVMLVYAVASGLLGWVGVVCFLVTCLVIAAFKIREHHDYRAWQRQVRRDGGWPTGLLTTPSTMSESELAGLRAAFDVARTNTVPVVTSAGTLTSGGVGMVSDRPLARRLIGIPGKGADIIAPHDLYATSDEPYRLLRRFVTSAGTVFYRDARGRAVTCADSGQPARGATAKLRAHMLTPGSVSDAGHPVRRSTPYSVQGWESGHPLVYTSPGRLLPGASDDAEMLARMPDADHWGVNALPDKVADPFAVGEEFRDPLWSETVETMAQDRTELVGRLRACERRLRTWVSTGPYPDMDVRAELVAAQDELSLIRGELMAAMGMPRFPGDVNTVDGKPKVYHGALPAEVSLTMDQWVKVPRETVVRLARDVHAACDCRYGHYAYHQLVPRAQDQAAGEVMRECLVCEPPTRWIETGKPTDGQA